MEWTPRRNVKLCSPDRLESEALKMGGAVSDWKLALTRTFGIVKDKGTSPELVFEIVLVGYTQISRNGQKRLELGGYPQPCSRADRRTELLSTQ